MLLALSPPSSRAWQRERDMVLQPRRSPRDGTVTQWPRKRPPACDVLTDDAMLHIFAMLEPEERHLCRRVSPRWAAVLAASKWRRESIRPEFFLASAKMFALMEARLAELVLSRLLLAAASAPVVAALLAARPHEVVPEILTLAAVRGGPEFAKVCDAWRPTPENTRLAELARRGCSRRFRLEVRRGARAFDWALREAAVHGRSKIAKMCLRHGGRATWRVPLRKHGQVQDMCVKWQLTRGLAGHAARKDLRPDGARRQAYLV